MQLRGADRPGRPGRAPGARPSPGVRPARDIVFAPAAAVPRASTPSLRRTEALLLGLETAARIAGTPGRHLVQLAAVQWELVRRGERLRRESA